MGSPTPPSQTSRDGSESFFMVAAIVAIALLLLLSNIVAFACCSPTHVVQAIRRFLQSRGFVAGDGSYAQLIPASKYRKESEAAECPVCLSVFADGEDVRRMPVCEHLFHASCIDMWLCSHSDCPLCRASVLPPPESCPRAGSRQWSSRQQLLAESRGSVGVPFNLV